MPLTPIDVQQKTFGPELRGYNMDEVDDFLDDVVATLKEYDQGIRDAQDRIRALEAEVNTRGEDETAISRALVAAQKQADVILMEAKDEADRIRSEAHDETSRLREERDAERMALTQDIARMRSTVADLKRRVIELAGSAEADLDEMDLAASDASDEIAGPFHDEEEEALTAAEEEDWEETAEEVSDEEEEPVSLDDIEESADESDLVDEAEEAVGAGQHLSDDASRATGRRPWERGSV